MAEDNHQLPLGLAGAFCTHLEAQPFAVEDDLVKPLALDDGSLLNRFHHDLDHAMIFPSNLTGAR